MKNDEENAAARAIQDHIEAAFRAVPYPGDENIVPSESRGSDSEEIAQAFSGKKWPDWKDKPLALLGAPEIEQSALFLFEVDAFLYYLPLFLIAATCHYKTANLIPGGVVSAFGTNGNPETAPWQSARLASLNPAQLAAVRACLEFLNAAHGADFPGDEIARAVQNVARESGRRAPGV